LQNLKTAFLRHETACLPRVWTVETNFFNELTTCRTVASVKYS